MKTKTHEFYKKPIFIACCVILLAYFMPYMKYEKGNTDYSGTGWSFTKNEMSLVVYNGRESGKVGQRTSISLSDKDRLPLVNQLSPWYRLTILLPLLALYIGFKLYKENEKYLDKLRLGLTILSALLFLIALYTALNEDMASIGIGVYLTLLVGIFIQFEEKIISKIQK